MFRHTWTSILERRTDSRRCDAPVKSDKWTRVDTSGRTCRRATLLRKAEAPAKHVKVGQTEPLSEETKQTDFACWLHGTSVELICYEI